MGSGISGWGSPTSVSGGKQAASSGGIGGWGGGGAPAASGGTENPVQAAQNSLNKNLSIIGWSGDQGAINKAQQVATHNKGGGWFSDVLSALDIPRAAVVSGVEQAGLGLKSALGNGGPGASFGGFLKGTENHVTVGHLLHTDAGIQNHLADSIGGIAGDVLFDPLTYAGGTGEIGRGLAVAGHVSDAVNATHKAAEAELAAKQAAAVADKVANNGKIPLDLSNPEAGFHTVESAQAAKEAAQQAAVDAKAQAKDLGGGVITPDTMARMQTKGVSGLNQAERDFIQSRYGIQMKTGYGLRAPFTGGRKSLTLVPGAVTDPLTGAAHEAVQRLANHQLMQKLGEKFVGPLQNLSRQYALDGNGEAAAAVNGIIQHTNVAQGVSRKAVNDFGPRAAEIVRSLPDEALPHLPGAVEGNHDALVALKEAAGGSDAVDKVQQLLSDIHQRALNTGVPIGTIEHGYWPHQLTEAARAAFEKSGNVKSAKQAFADAVNRRTLVPGEQFLGQPLEHGTIDEINQIAHDVYGKDAFDVFNTDPRQVLNHYIHGMARTIGRQHLANKLDEMGVTASGDMARTPEEWQALMARAERSLGKQGRQAGRQASKLGKRAADVQRVVDQTAAGFAPPEKGRLAKALADIEQRARNMEAEAHVAKLPPWATSEERKAVAAAIKSSSTPLSADQIVEHGNAMLGHLTAGATSHGEAAQRLAEAANRAGEESVQHAGSNVSLGHLGAQYEGSTAPQYVHDALAKLAEIQAHPKNANKALQFYDKALNAWKQYALAMPGKAIRHTVAGPSWYAFIGNVSIPALRRGFATWRAYMKSGVDRLPEEARARVEAGIEHGIFHGHEFNPEDLTGPTTRTGRFNKAVHNPLSTKRGYFRKNQELQRAAQDYWRFAMFNDAMDKGFSAAAAAQKVRMFMGDPHHITNFERSSVRRAVPFYTFLRQNVPVELKTLATQPGKFVNSYDAAKNETEQWSSPDQIVPSYFQQTLGIRTPLTSGGSHVYLSPDFPFARLGEIFSGDPNQIVSQTSPLLQDAVGVLEHTNTFTGQPFNPTAKQAPGAWTRIPGLMEALHAVAPGSVLKTNRAITQYGQTTPQGTWMITPQAESVIESLMPLLGQARRAAPTEANMKGRQGTSIASDLVGQNLRTNDPYQQAGELYRRNAALKAMIENLNNRGLVKLPYGFQK